MQKSACRSETPGLIAMTLSLLAGAAIQTPQLALGQSVMWHGTQQQQGTNHRVQTGANNRAALQQGAPGYFQHPPTGQSALRGANRPGTDYPTANQGAPANQWPQPGQFSSAQADAGWNQQSANQLAQEQQAARQRAQQDRRERDPLATPVLSPAAMRFFQNLKGPNLSTWNQNRSNYSFVGQTRPSTKIPGTTWRASSRFGQSYSHRSVHNQTNFNQNRFNYSLHNITAPGLRGYR